MKKVTLMHNGVAKIIEVNDEVGAMLENAYADSRVYGLGGSTARKLKDFFAKEIEQYREISSDEEQSGRSRSMLFCEVFGIYSNESPLLIEALQWVENHKDDEGFSSRMITLDTFLQEDVLGERLPYQYNPYMLLVADFEGWDGKRMVEAQLNVSFVRFCKFFYALIK